LFALLLVAALVHVIAEWKWLLLAVAVLTLIVMLLDPSAIRQNPRRRSSGFAYRYAMRLARRPGRRKHLFGNMTYNGASLKRRRKKSWEL
jgi:hypothetical protein